LHNHRLVTVPRLPPPAAEPPPAGLRGLTAPPPLPASAAGDGDRLFKRRTGSPMLVLKGQGGAGVEPDSGGPLAQRLRPTATPGVSAGLLRNTATLIPQGAMLDCVLETRLISTVPGMTRCILSEDAWSADGSSVLLPRGTALTGEYRSGLRLGEARLFVLWTRARTPAGVVVTLASPGTDALGAAGIGGHLDNQWFTRFASALVLSLVDDAARIASDGASEQSRTVGGLERGTSMIIREGLDVEPVLTVQQGTSLKVFVARDLDFTDVVEAGRGGP
jgi:type IV secretion system protein VirB10